MNLNKNKNKEDASVLLPVRNKYHMLLDPINNRNFHIEIKETGSADSMESIKKKRKKNKKKGGSYCLYLI